MSQNTIGADQFVGALGACGDFAMGQSVGSGVELFVPTTSAVSGVCLVVGDGLEDVYLRGVSTAPNPDVAGGSKFDGVGVVKSGGAGNVVQNIVALGAACEAVTPVCQTKLRVLGSANELVCRFDFPPKTPPQEAEVFAMACGVAEWLSGSVGRVLVVSDYAKGTITKQIIDVIAEWAQADLRRRVLIDTKQSPGMFAPISSAIGRSCAFLPNRQEHAKYALLYDKLPMIVRTEGSDGVSWMEYGEVVAHVDASALAVLNATGAGDTVTAAMAVGLMSNMSAEATLEFAMEAAAQVVRRPLTDVVVNGALLTNKYQKISQSLGEGYERKYLHTAKSSYPWFSGLSC